MIMLVESEAEAKISICDLLKNDSSEIIHKIETTVPTFIQDYTDLFAAHLKLYDALFGTCYIAEKEFFDKLNLDQNFLNNLKKSSEYVKDQTIGGIEFNTRIFDIMTKMRVSTIHTYDLYMKTMMQSFASMAASFNGKDNF